MGEGRGVATRLNVCVCVYKCGLCYVLDVIYSIKTDELFLKCCVAHTVL